MSGLSIDPTHAQALSHWASTLSAPRLLTPSEVEDATAELEQLGWSRRILGYSRQGRPIWCVEMVSQGSAWPVVGYGYPHPDEPSGATGLLELARQISSQGPPPGLEQVSWHLVLCADPDQAQPNQPWMEQPQLSQFLRGHWRPAYLGLEVDYAFPIDHGPLLQPRGWAPEGMKRPLPESLALADLFTQVRPQVVGMMHGNHASGVYSFLSHRPEDSLLNAYDQLGSSLGLPAHLGEKPDPGKRWRAARPDLLKERKIKERIDWLSSVVGEPGERRFFGCVSAGMFLEALAPQCVVLTPEVGMWMPEGIGDTSPSGQSRRVWQQLEETRRGRRWVVRGEMRMPDGSARRVCYHIRPESEAGPEGEYQVALTRGMAGVEAVERRRWWLAQSDALWDAYKSQMRYPTDRKRERENITVPARSVNDRSMLIFRTSASYLRPASVSEAVDLRQRWSAQDCLWLGHALQLYQEQGLTEPAERCAQLLEQAESQLRLQSVPLDAQIRSQVGRLLLTVAARLQSPL